MAQTPHTVVVHPLVLLSVVDHFNRIAREARVVGILLGESYRGKIEVTNSYAVPFEEDARDPSIWFLDHNYHENMFGMFKKVNAKERVVGWYSTGPKIRESDIAINELIRKYTSNPVLVIIDVKPKEIGLPTEAYVAVEEVSTDGSETHMSFRNIASEIGAQEAEEVGVEHLLRDIKDARVSTLAGEVSGKLSSLKGLAQRIGEIEVYLADVHAGKLPTNHAVLSALQDMFNLMPNLRDPALARAFAVKTNDMHLSVYIASIIRGIIALHDLINNKLANKEREQKLAQEREKKENPAAEAKKTEGEQKDEKEEKKEEEQKKQ